jgi:hypothetical protein
MANTIRVIEAFEFLREGVRAKSVPQATYSISTTSELAPINEQVVGTTHEAIAIGDVTDTAFCEISVITDTAVVSIGGDSGGSFVKWFDVQKGDPPARMPRVGTLASTYLKSDTASTTVQVKLIKIVAPA